MVKLSKEYVEGCLELADSENSKLTAQERELTGDNSPKLKSLINNLCAKDGTTYLELGLYRGASFISAMYGNLQTKAVGVDNFSYDTKEVKKTPPKGFIWTNVQSALHERIKVYSNTHGPQVFSEANVKIIEEDFEKVEWQKQPRFDVINFDILPITYDNLDALFDLVIKKAAAMECVLIINGYSDIQKSEWVDSTLERYSSDFEVNYKFQRVSSGQRDYFGYYSGICVVGLTRKVESKPVPTKSAAQKSTVTVTPPKTKSDK